MRIEQAIFNRLSTFAGLTALVGARIYPVRLPTRPDYPAISYFRVSRAANRTFGGNTPSASPRLQFDCWAKTYTGVKAIADQVIAALEGFSGTLGGPGGVDVQAIYLENEMDSDFEDSADLYHTILEFTVWHA